MQIYTLDNGMHVPNIIKTIINYFDSHKQQYKKFIVFH